MQAKTAEFMAAIVERESGGKCGGGERDEGISSERCERGSGGSVDKVRLPHSALANSAFPMLLLVTFLWRDFNFEGPLLSSYSPLLPFL